MIKLFQRYFMSRREPKILLSPHRDIKHGNIVKYFVRYSNAVSYESLKTHFNGLKKLDSPEK